MAKYGNARIVPKEFVSMVNAPYSIEHLCQDAARELIDKVIVEARKGECIIKLTEEQFDRYDQNAIELRETIEIQPLVRCKDCIFYREKTRSCGSDAIDSKFRIIMPDWFCADAIRKEENNAQRISL